MLLAVATLSPEAVPAVNRTRRRRRLASTAAFVLVLALPMLADSGAPLSAALLGPEAAEGLPLAAPYPSGLRSLPMVALFAWGVWMRALAGRSPARDEPPALRRAEVAGGP